MAKRLCLNPCCSGRWSRTTFGVCYASVGFVLILVVVEDGLVQAQDISIAATYLGLNPCCSGRWSRTYVVFIKAPYPP